ncbi:MAG TPA: hypothetical protein VFO70_04920 [Chitinophagaceae bacterium]|nr:hypothetical protein [Chitinophagaceae bacterium]
MHINSDQQSGAVDNKGIAPSATVFETIGCKSLSSLIWARQIKPGKSSYLQLFKQHRLQSRAGYYRIPHLQHYLSAACHYMPLRNFMALAFLTVLTLTHSYGQGKLDKSSIITQIKQVYRQINDYKNYNVVTIDDSEEFLGHGTDNGGSLKGYYKFDSLKKIVEWVGLSNRVVQNEYYFDRGNLVFVYSIDSRYRFNDSTAEFDYSRFDKVYKGRYYFSKDKLIDTIHSDKEQEKTKQKDATNFLTSSKNYMILLNQKRK